MNILQQQNKFEFPYLINIEQLFIRIIFHVESKEKDFSDVEKKRSNSIIYCIIYTQH